MADAPDPMRLLAEARRASRLRRQVAETFDRTLGGYAAPASPVREDGGSTAVGSRISAAHGPHFGIGPRMRATIVADSVPDSTPTPLVFTDPPADAGDGSIALDATGESAVVTDTGFYAVTARVAVTGASGTGHAEVTLTFDPDGDNVPFDDTRTLVPTAGATTVFNVSATYWLEAGERITGSIEQVSGAAADVAGHIAVVRLSSHLIAEPAGDVVEPVQFLAFGQSGNVGHSEDGTTWDALWGTGDPFGNESISSMRYHSDGQWWATTSTYIAWAADPSTGWTLATWGTATGAGVTILTDGLAAKVRGEGIYTNPDPTVPGGWALAYAFPANVFAYGLAHGNGIFVAHYWSNDTGSVIVTSPDGGTWTEHVAPRSQAGTHVWFTGGLFFLSAAGQFFVSTDGETWTGEVAMALLDGHNLDSVLYHDGLYVALASGSTGEDSMILTSTNGYDWTVRDLPAALASHTYSSPRALYGLVWGEGKWVAPLQAGTGNTTVRGVLTSEDGLVWEWTELSRITNGINEGGTGFGYGNETPNGIAVGPR